MEMFRSPWRYFQNLFMGLGTGMDMQVGTKNPKVFVNFLTFELT